MNPLNPRLTADIVVDQLKVYYDPDTGKPTLNKQQAVKLINQLLENELELNAYFNVINELGDSGDFVEKLMSQSNDRESLFKLRNLSQLYREKLDRIEKFLQPIGYHMKSKTFIDYTCRFFPLKSDRLQRYGISSNGNRSDSYEKTQLYKFGDFVTPTEAKNTFSRIIEYLKSNKLNARVCSHTETSFTLEFFPCKESDHLQVNA